MITLHITVFIVLYAREIHSNFLYEEFVLVYDITQHTPKKMIYSLTSHQHLRLTLADFRLKGFYVRLHSLQQNTSVVKSFTSYILYTFYVLLSLCLIKCLNAALFLLIIFSGKKTSKQRVSLRFITRLIFWKLRFAIFITNVTAMYQTHILLWEVHVHIKFRSVCSDNVVLGIQIDYVCRFTVPTKIILTGTSIVFSFLLTS